MSIHDQPVRPREQQDLDRRGFLKTSAALGAAGLAGVGCTGAGAAAAESAKQAASETLVKQLHDSLDEEQRGKICFPFAHKLRSEVDNNWHITKTRLARDLDKDQHQLVVDIFRGLHSEQYADQVLAQVDHDNRSKDLATCSIALFGRPGEKFEFVLTGRHVTRRCDGNSVEGAAFGGPIFYGHSAGGFNEKPDHPGNIYWYQAKRANELFQALDGKQREQALRSDPRDESGNDTVALSGKSTGLPGVACGDLSTDQQELVRKVMDDVLAPFREVDRKESLQLIEKSGFEHLHMSYYKNMDIGNDQVWDVWQIEGPNMVWYFRGSPHVHTWVYIRDQA